MYVPPEIASRIEELGRQIGCPLSVVQCWINEFQCGGMYCRFRGVVHDSPTVMIEVAGTLCVDPRPDRDCGVDLFLFVNGRRVGPYDETYKYLVGHVDGEFIWDNLDEGFDGFDTLDDSFGGPVDESIAIRPPAQGKDTGIG